MGKLRCEDGEGKIRRLGRWGRCDEKVGKLRCEDGEGKIRRLGRWGRCDEKMVKGGKV